jgi:GMP synthase (glutamine-hydrolysing)
VTSREPWADRAASFLRDAVAANRWVLGVCYGHQLLAHALGGVVETNPNGYEAGTIRIELTQDGRADPLLSGASEFHSTHFDAVSVLPANARLLASTPKTRVQAFRAGERAWGVQFHPEFDEEIMRLYIEKRAASIARLDEVRKSVRATPQGPALLRRFVELARS